jgi:hypothetical protein
MESRLGVKMFTLLIAKNHTNVKGQDVETPPIALPSSSTINEMFMENTAVERVVFVARDFHQLHSTKGISILLI